MSVRILVVYYVHLMVEPPTPPGLVRECPGLVRECPLVRLNKPVLDLNVVQFETREGFLRKNLVAVSCFQNCAIYQYSYYMYLSFPLNEIIQP